MSQILAILWKDIRAELRTKDIFISMFVFILLTLITFNFAFSGEKLRPEVVAGAMWVSYLFAAVLGLSRSLVHEKDKGCLEGLLLCPMERSAIYFGKALGNFLFLLIVQVLSLPFFSVFFTQAELLKRPLYLFISFILGSAGISAVGTLFSAITVNTKARELLLPVLLFPILLPVLIGAVKLTLFVLDPQPIYEPLKWVQLLLIYDIIFVLFSNLTFHYVVEE